MSKLTTTNVGISRRKLLIGSACMAAAASLPAATTAATAKQANDSHPGIGGYVWNSCDQRFFAPLFSWAIFLLFVPVFFFIPVKVEPHGQSPWHHT